MIGTDGSLGAWSVEPSFQSGRSGASAARLGDCLYLTGGSASGSYFADTQYARIQSDGHISSWSTSPNRLKTPRSNHSLLGQVQKALDNRGGDALDGERIGKISGMVR